MSAAAAGQVTTARPDVALHAAVHAFYARQIHLLDHGDVDGFAATFTADGRFFHHPNGRLEPGRDNIATAMRGFLARAAAAGVVRHHWFGMFQIDPGADGTIVVTYYSLVSHTDAERKVTLEPTGVVQDVLVEVDGVLLNSSRTVKPDTLRLR
ncbi:nuclear transport factor 2 family protein [Catellatospora tritici]|uniref:nuclear transport factor 2 family protein n=1 Tax=Catellatospora tritici TaxID=2851566 RepID=UPI001C2D9E3C|nr:nuclear transport factor 2 family protein [Catellatospora tritici]MBV1855587.1 nuclear transport factor 2 family protein [Catellatospora tritici]